MGSEKVAQAKADYYYSVKDRDPALVESEISEKMDALWQIMKDAIECECDVDIDPFERSEKSVCDFMEDIAVMALAKDRAENELNAALRSIENDQEY